MRHSFVTGLVRFNMLTDAFDPGKLNQAFFTKNLKA